MICSRCQKDFDEQAKFCPHCGQERLVTPFSKWDSTSSRNSKKTILKIVLALGIGILFVIIQSSHWRETTFGVRHTVSGIATNYVQVGNGIEANTYQVLASVDGGEEQYVVVQAMVPLDYFIRATCVEAGTVKLVSGTGSAEYPFYIQVGE